MTETNKYVKKEPCPNCGSKDNLAVYSDGHAFCFGCSYRVPAPTETKHKRKSYYSSKPVTQPLIKFVQHKELPHRKITEETAKFFNYGYAEQNGERVQVATYEDQLGRPVAQHLRLKGPKGKTFRWVGDCKNVQLWGQKLWRQHGSYGNIFAVITEGEIDAMSISQVQGNKFPVVSLPSGAQSANKYLAANLKWLNQFAKIVLCFDSDEPGIQAAEKAIEILPAGKAAICRLPRKDANEMLLAGEGEELKSLLWKATPVRPDSILNANDLWEELTKEGASSVCPFPYPMLDQFTRGFRKSQMITICAGSGTGKSSLCRELAHHFLKNKLTVGYIALEESVQRTMQGILGIELNKPLHLEEQIEEVEGLKPAFDQLFGTEKLFLYDHFGSMEPDRLIEQIQYMATAEGVDVVILDHLTIVISGLADVDERRAIDITCTKLRQVVESTGVAIILVSHLRRPQGVSHEQGSQVSTSDLRGSSAILQLSDLCISAERNQQGDPAERSEMQLRILKNRHTGSTGPIDKLLYDENTGRLSIPMSTYFGA